MEPDKVGQKVILPDTRILWRVNETGLFSGLDHLDECVDKTHFANYPYTVDYQYNSRGFRDLEWPTDIDELRTAVWCIGDSFTAGVGSPFNHTWPQLLQKRLDQRTINISLDGGSNNWIARQTDNIIREIAPELIVIQWSYSHRREAPLSEALDPAWQEYYKNIRAPNWPDCDSVDQLDQLPEYIRQEIQNHERFNIWASETDTDSERRRWWTGTTDEQDIANTQACIDLISQGPTQIIHSFIPGWHPNKDYHLNFHGSSVVEFEQVDLARDGAHYDIKTAARFVDLIVDKL
jgi:hypothetical protein